MWAYGGDASTTAAVYGDITGNFANNGEYWTLLETDVTGNYWTVVTNGSTLTINGLPKNDSQRGSLSAVIIEEIRPLPALHSRSGDWKRKLR